jgi:hypothetical protein
MTEPMAEGAEDAQRLIQKRSGHTGPRTACTNHCATCGGHFSSLSAFDAHRRGNHQDGTRHCDVDATNEQGEPLIVPKTENGSCDLKNGEPLESGATIYALRDWWKTGQAFADRET